MANIKIKRLFVALNINEDIKKYLYSCVKSFKIKSRIIKYVESSNYHITLLFIGEVNHSEEKIIKSILNNYKNSLGEIEIKIVDVDAFPSLNNPRIFYFKCVQTKGKELNSIRAQLNEEFQYNKLPNDNKEIRLHITFARNNDNNIILPEKFNIRERTIRFKSFALMESELKPSGPQYKIVEKYEL